LPVTATPSTLNAMTNFPAPSIRLAALALVATGLLTVVLSVADWGACPTTPCGGFLLAISEYSGIDLGFGIVTMVAGVALVAIGLDGLRRRQAPRVATIAALMALLIVATAGALVIWMYVLPGPAGEDGFYAPLGMAFLIAKDFYWPPYTAVVVGAVGLVALGASLRMRRALRRPE
jgi:hypothetical protein